MPSRKSKSPTNREIRAVWNRKIADWELSLKNVPKFFVSIKKVDKVS